MALVSSLTIKCNWIRVILYTVYMYFFFSTCRRFEPNFCSVREKVMKKELGNLRLIKVTSRDLAPPPISYIKTSGGKNHLKIIYGATVCYVQLNL